jgi:RNA polymerase sigma factor (sigma-70 family)
MTTRNRNTNREQLRLVADALNELPERARTAFEMHRLGGHSFLEISKRLHISVGLAHQLVRDVMAHCALRVERGQF